MSTWSRTEENFLSVNYGAMPTVHIYLYLSHRHSLNSVYCKAHEMGLTKKYKIT